MAYGTIAGWRAYALERGNSAPTDATDAEATAALVRASDYIRMRYVANLMPGYDATFIPTGSDLPLVEEATYIAASYELATPGFFSKTWTEDQRKVLTKVDSIQWTVTGDTSKYYAAFPTSSLIDALFLPYIYERDGMNFMFASIGPGVCL